MNPTKFRAILYFLIAFLTPFTGEVMQSLQAGQWPTTQKLAAALLVSLMAGLLALRAYYDGSALRNAQEQKQDVTITNL